MTTTDHHYTFLWDGLEEELGRYEPHVVTEARQARDRGIAYLDRVEPDWRKKLDIERLDLQSTCDCVLGQLYTHKAVVSLPDGAEHYTDPWGVGPYTNGFMAAVVCSARKTGERHGVVYNPQIPTITGDQCSSYGFDSYTVMLEADGEEHEIGYGLLTLVWQEALLEGPMA